MINLDITFPRAGASAMGEGQALAMLEEIPLCGKRGDYYGVIHGHEISAHSSGSHAERP
jgi:hypothetical protein